MPILPFTCLGGLVLSMPSVYRSQSLGTSLGSHPTRPAHKGWWDGIKSVLSVRSPWCRETGGAVRRRDRYRSLSGGRSLRTFRTGVCRNVSTSASSSDNGRCFPRAGPALPPPRSDSAVDLVIPAVECRRVSDGGSSATFGSRERRNPYVSPAPKADQNLQNACEPIWKRSYAFGGDLFVDTCLSKTYRCPSI